MWERADTEWSWLRPPRALLSGFWPGRNQSVALSFPVSSCLPHCGSLWTTELCTASGPKAQTLLLQEGYLGAFVGLVLTVTSLFGHLACWCVRAEAPSSSGAPQVAVPRAQNPCSLALLRKGLGMSCSEDQGLGSWFSGNHGTPAPRRLL